MRGFVNPCFIPVSDNIQITPRRTFDAKNPENQKKEEFKEYDKILSTLTDPSSQLNDSLLKPFDNSIFNDSQVNSTSHHSIRQLLQETNKKRQYDFSRQKKIIELIKSYSPKVSKIMLEQKKDNKLKSIQQNMILQESSLKKFDAIHNINKILNNKNIGNQTRQLFSDRTGRSCTGYSPQPQISQQQINVSKLCSPISKKQQQKDLLCQNLKQTDNFEQATYSLEIKECNKKLITLYKLFQSTYKIKDIVIEENIKICLQINNLCQLFEKGIQILQMKKQQITKNQFILHFYLDKILNCINQKKILLIKDNNNQQVDMTTNETTTECIQDENEKQEFFKLVVEQKLDLPRNHPGKFLLLQDLYEKAIQTKQKKENWNQFIQSQLLC